MEKISMRLDIGILNKMIGMTYKKNQYITIFNLRNLQKLLNNLDLTTYQNKSVIIKRIDFLKRSLEARLDRKFQDESLIINYANEDVEDPVINDIINNLHKYKQLTHSEIVFINSMVEDRLKYGLLTNRLSELTDIIEKIDSSEFSTYAQAFNWVEDWISKFKADLRKIKSELGNGVLRFNDDNIGERIDDILTKLGTTQSIIISGIQMLNQMLAPGYRGGKLYCYAALPANFKSGLLLKTAIDCIKFNAKSYRGKKESHKKAVVYFTMENTNEESFERTFNMTVNKDDIMKHDSKYIEAEMRKAGIIGNEDMELIMVYKPNRSISTQDIRNFIEELDEEGIEVVMLCFDYVKRIRSLERAMNEKEELKNVTNELRQIAIDFDIPVVTAAQLNRQAAQIINATVRSGKADALKEIDGSAIGSAWEILENSDVVILINMQRRKKDGKLFLSFLLCKQRYHDSDIKFFNQPFSEETFDLVNDIMDKQPAGLISLATDFEDVDLELYKSRGRRVHTEDGDINIFDDEAGELFTVRPVA